MKQWLYNGWCRFKEWVLFNYWKRLSNDDYEDLVRLYHKKRCEKIAMKKYIEHLDAHSIDFKRKSESWYVGDIHSDWIERIDAKIKEKENG